MHTDDGTLEVGVPRDRAGTCEPQLIGKHERRFTGFDDKIIGLYARGMTVREIRAFLADLRARGCEDIFIAVTDGLTGMPAALRTIYQAPTADAAAVALDAFERTAWPRGIR